jgi:phosphoglucosamine mutase
MKKLFGTDGVRGVAGEFPLDEKTVFIIGRSLANNLKRSHAAPKFVTGRDTRESGIWIERALQSGAESAGAKCESSGVITTPGVAFIAKEFAFDAGIVISASHNPFRDNGIKIFSLGGVKLDEATEREIEKDVFRGEESKKVFDTSSAIHAHRAEEFQNAYLKHFLREFASLKIDSLKLVVDCANGAASDLAPRLLREFGAEIIAINAKPNGRNINENCGSLHLDDLQKHVVKDSADLGIAFDGDADRSLFVDETGAVVDGDAVMFAMALHLKSHGLLKDDTVVATVMSNLGLEVALRRNGINLVRTQVGDKYVLEKLTTSGLSIGGEQSGHIIFPSRSLVGDGILSALFLLEAMTGQAKSLSQITKGFQRFPQTLINVPVKEKRDFAEVAEIAEAARQIESELGEKGRLLLRYSGTENLARVMIEGENQSEIEAQARRLVEVIRKSLN